MATCAQEYAAGLVASSDPASKIPVAIMGPIWGRQDPGGPHVGPINFAIWGALPLSPDPIHASLNAFFFFN